MANLINSAKNVLDVLKEHTRRTFDIENEQNNRPARKETKPSYLSVWHSEKQHHKPYTSNNAHL